MYFDECWIEISSVLQVHNIIKTVLSSCCGKSHLHTFKPCPLVSPIATAAWKSCSNMYGPARRCVRPMHWLQMPVVGLMVQPLVLPLASAAGNQLATQVQIAAGLGVEGIILWGSSTDYAAGCQQGRASWSLGVGGRRNPTK